MRVTNVSAFHPSILHHPPHLGLTFSVYISPPLVFTEAAFLILTVPRRLITMTPLSGLSNKISTYSFLYRQFSIIPLLLHRIPHEDASHYYSARISSLFFLASRLPGQPHSGTIKLSCTPLRQTVILQLFLNNAPPNFPPEKLCCKFYGSQDELVNDLWTLLFYLQEDLSLSFPS